MIFISWMFAAGLGYLSNVLWRWAMPRIIGCLIIAVLCLPAQEAGGAQADLPALVAVGVEGLVTVEFPSQPQVITVVPGMPLPLPCTIRTASRSRLTLRAGAITIIRAGAETEMRFLPAPDNLVTVQLQQGQLFFLHRDAPGQFSVETPTALVKVEGTGFSIRVAVNKTTTIALFDGQLEASNSQGSTNLIGYSAAVVEPGQAPRLTPALSMQRAMQWNLYYPAIVDPEELELGTEISTALAASLASYRAGNLLAALAEYPRDRRPASRSEELYLAGLLLSVGDVESAQPLVNQTGQPLPAGNEAVTRSVQQGLERLIAVVSDEKLAEPASPGSVAEWLAVSYYRQGQGDLGGALAAARKAVETRTNFAFAHARVAELEFGHGRSAEADRALTLALALAPQHAQALAVRGFVLAARNRHREARVLFDQATLADPSLANGWLGRGLCRIHAGDQEGGMQDLLTAAAVEPQRGVLRSYLAKGFQLRGLLTEANRELKEAERLDPGDPTAWLYAALLNREQFRFNQAIDDLERSVRLNDNRQLFRSRLLLDQDRAVRGANLAAIYRDAGMTDVGVREAADAVTSDYANYSAHLFLANSYNDLRDPNGVTLRYETATFSEYLLANLLTPVGGSALSPYVSQQEYSKLFEQDRVGISSQTTYLSGGDWQQQVSQYGWTKNTGYALDMYYRSQNGERPNNDLEQKAASLQLKQQLTAQDSVYLQAIFTDFKSGDMRQLYDARTASPNLRVTERQTPNLLAGYHHEWSPQLHTLLLVARLEDWFSLTNTDVLIRGVVRDAGGAVVDTVEAINRRFGIDPPSSGDTFDRYKFRSSFEAYSAELQQIAQLPRHTFVAGARMQSGETESYANETRGSGRFPPFNSGAQDFVAVQKNTTDLTRLSLYGYEQWHALDSLWLTAGLSYDYLEFPRNTDLPPISDKQRTKSQVSPKAGFIWTPQKSTAFRGAYTRSLGGLFFDGSVRLEPVQIAGFNQAYRSLIPESIEGAISGSEFQTVDFGFEQRFKTRTYLVVQAEWLQSDADRDVGAFDFDPSGANNAAPSQLRQSLAYEEQSIVVSVNQLLGRDWSLGARYKWSQAELKSRYPGENSTLLASTDDRAELGSLELHAILNHPSGFFASAQGWWFDQNNQNPSPPGDDFWQFNLLAGYRLPRRQVEMTAGLLNLTDQDYRLNPLNLYPTLPRERTLMFSVKLNF